MMVNIRKKALKNIEIAQKRQKSKGIERYRVGALKLSCKGSKLETKLDRAISDYAALKIPRKFCPVSIIIMQLCNSIKVILQEISRHDMHDVQEFI